ncbi:MAG: VCBS repeat-containing protein [Deltaproteobacteria bacterium]|nr:VCBS repeat-containing protein [Deltaproteobacteria bacterium]
MSRSFTCPVALSLLLSGCTLGDLGISSWDAPTCEQQRSLAISPASPASDRPMQEIDVEIRGVDLSLCEPQVFFGREQFSIVARSLEDPSESRCPSAQLTVLVPSAWRGEYPVSLRCGPVELDDQDVYRAEPRGWFLSAATGFHPFESSPLCRAAVADLDADGAIDQVAAEPDGISIRTFRGAADGPRIERRVVPGTEGIEPYCIRAQDLNADGLADLVWSWQGAFHVALQAADGDLAMREPVVYDSGDPWCFDILSGDLDGDGDVDLFGVMMDHPHQVLLNTGHGRFEVQPDAVHTPRVHATAGLLLDVDRDGDLDAVVAGGFPGGSLRNRVYENDGRGRFEELPGALGEAEEHSWSVQAIDLNGETVVVFGSLDARPSFFALRDGRLEALGPLGIEMAGVVSPVGQSANPDLITANLLTTRISHHVWNGELGVYTERRSAFLPGLLFSLFPVRIADFDGDGFEDLLSSRALLLYRDLASRFPLD